MIEDVKVTVLVSQLRIGGHPFHIEEVTYHRGQELNLPEDYAIRLGTSVRIHIHEPEPTANTPAQTEESIPVESEEEPEPAPEPGPKSVKSKSIQTLSTEGAIKLIKKTESPDELADYLKQESTGRKRKRIMDAINAKIAAD